MYAEARIKKMRRSSILSPLLASFTHSKQILHSGDRLYKSWTDTLVNIIHVES